MLVSFSIQNFRSFASKQTLSMVAGAGATRQERVSFPSENAIAPQLLRSACLFGANGSGKSNVVKALDFFQKFVVSSAKDTQEGEAIDVTSFKFDDDWIDQPTELEVTFIHGDSLYQYGFAVDQKRVWSEWLFSKPNTAGTKNRTLFQREYDAEEEQYVWEISKTNVKGQKELWKKSTRDNALFLSTAIHLKADAFKEPFAWMRSYLRIIKAPERFSKQVTAKRCNEDEGKVLGFLRSVDTRIQDIDVTAQDFTFNDKEKSMLSEATLKTLNEALLKAKSYQIQFAHSNKSGGMTYLDFDEESDGTQVLFNLTGPWLDVLENGYTLVVDELHNSLHPHALKFLINLFLDPKINTNKAQLIFTSHETSVMAKGFMHQDQIWLTEKDEDESSQLIPLSDFKVRDVTAFQKAYLDGRYGAVPKLKAFVNG